MSRPHPYDASRGFHAALDHRPTILSLVVGLAACELVFTLTGTLIDAPVSEYATPTVATLVSMASFGFFGATAFVLASRVQRRSPATLFGPPALVLGDMLRVARWLFLFFLALNFIPPWDFSGFSLNMAPVHWALLLPASLAVVLIQIGAEEVIYRGWLQQSLARLSPSPVVWMGLPSIVFGLGHWSPDLPPPEAMAYVIWATAFGLACADLTARTGSLGAALGFHFMTNVMSIVLVSLEGPGDGLALFTIPWDEARPETSWITLAFDLFYLWMAWMAARIALRR